MKNTEAIKLIQGIEEDGRNVTSEHVEALNLAIKALEQPQDDLISREDLKKALEVTQYNDIDDLTRTERLIVNAPTIHHPDCDTCEDKAKQYMLGFQDGFSTGKERPKGKWVKCKDGYTRCDQCGSRGSAIKARFCHHCGANMRGGDSECHGEQ